jgi:hypothetical protein
LPKGVELGAADADETPLAFMLRIMRDLAAPMELRVRMALGAAAYVHPRGGIGKKEEAQVTAGRVGTGRLATPPTPLRLIKGNKP